MTTAKPSIRPSTMSKDEFVAAFGGVFEHSAWIAEQTFEAGIAAEHDTVQGLHTAMSHVFRSATESKKLAVLNAHPDLAGKLAAAKRLTPESTSEQASAGLNALTDEERETFTTLNAAYVAKHGFPFIIAVKGLDKTEILAAFEQRIDNDRATEFQTACRQVERIALLRLTDMLPGIAIKGRDNG